MAAAPAETEPPAPETTAPRAAAPAEPQAQRPPSGGDADPPPADDDEPGDGPPPAPPPSAPTAPAEAPAGERSTAASLFGAPALRPPSGDGSTAALAVPAAPGAPAAAARDLGPALGQTRDAWGAVMDALRADGHVRLASVLANGRPERVVRGAVEVALPDAFAVTVAQSEGETIGAALHAVLGAGAPALTYVARASPVGETVAAVDPFERLKQLREEHPVVRALFERFGAEIVW